MDGAQLSVDVKLVKFLTDQFLSHTHDVLNHDIQTLGY